MVPQLHDAIDGVRSFLDTIEGVLIEMHGTPVDQARQHGQVEVTGPAQNQTAQQEEAERVEAARLEAEREELYRED